MEYNVIHSKVDYFKAFSNYFWNWEDNGTVISSSFTNTTIGYREDITLLLNDIAPSISPRLGSVLLILYACSDKFIKPTYENAKDIINNAEEDNTSKEILEYHIVKAFRLLRKINKLPEELKKGQKRVLLLNELLQHNKITIPNFKEILSDFNSGNYDGTIFTEQHQVTYAEILADFHVLSEIDDQYASSEILKEKLETGVVGLKKTDSLLEEKDFLKSLLNHKETAVLSDIASHLIAGLKIPVSSENTGDLSLGGVSDVTNKGDFDKLLLSELAYNEELFLSRLINNEALYFKREIASENISKNRILLLDTTIKVWGTPRIIELALALAFKYHPKSNIQTKVFLLDGDSYTEATLNSIKEVKNTLKLLSPHLDCSNSLDAFLKSDEINTNDEVIFFVEDSNFKTEEVQKIFNENSQIFNFLATIHRNGTVNYFSIMNGMLKHMGDVDIDIESIVNKKRTFGNKKNNTDFFQYERPPFIPTFYQEAPKYAILNRITNYPEISKVIYLPNEKGIILKNRYNELVHYPNKSQNGGYVLEKNIGSYHYKFVLSNTKEKVYLLTYTPKRLAGFSTIHLDDFSVDYYDIKQSFNLDCKKIFVTTFNEDFYIKAGRDSYIFDKDSLTLIASSNIKSNEKESKEQDYSVGRMETPFVNINKVKITNTGELTINDDQILTFNQASNQDTCNFTNKYTMSYYNEGKNLSYVVSENTQILKRTTLFNNSKLKFRYVTFKDGSEILFDNKGFAHLKSANENIPEITIQLNLNSNPCFYVDSEAICAPTNMVHRDFNVEILEPSEINERYLTPFINNILTAYENGN